MFSSIKQQIDKYSEYLNTNKTIALNIRKQLLENKFKGFVEEPIQKINFQKEGKVLGVDSGFIDSRLTGLDFCYIKSAGSYFEYNETLVKYDRLTLPKYSFKISNSILQKDEVHKFVSINRLREELNLLYDGIKNKNPEYALIDGNILPQAVDRPQNTSELYLDYENLLQDFVKLYDLAKSQDICLLGTVEDSRANSFLKLINEKNKKVDDILFLNFLLEDHEAISFFPIFSVESNIIYNDLKAYGEYSFLASYFKLPEDYPLRIELLNNNYSLEKLKKIRNFIAYISSFTKRYTYPSVLLDADKQAKLNNSEIGIVKSLVESAILSKGIKHLRRERRI